MVKSQLKSTESKGICCVSSTALRMANSRILSAPQLPSVVWVVWMISQVLFGLKSMEKAPLSEGRCLQGTNSAHGCESLNSGCVTLARTALNNNASKSCWRCTSLMVLSLESPCVCSARAGCSSAAVSKDFVCWHKDSVQLVWAIIYQTTSTSTRTLQDNHRVGQGARKLRGCKMRLWNSSCFSSYYLRSCRTIRSQNPT